MIFVLEILRQVACDRKIDLVLCSHAWGRVLTPMANKLTGLHETTLANHYRGTSGTPGKVYTNSVPNNYHLYPGGLYTLGFTRGGNCLWFFRWCYPLIQSKGSSLFLPNCTSIGIRPGRVEPASPIELTTSRTEALQAWRPIASSLEAFTQFVLHHA